MKAIIYLTGTSLTTDGPRVDHPGASGMGHSYHWSPAHQRHILDGRELDAADLDRVSADIFQAEKGYRVPIPKLVSSGAPTATPPEAPSVESLYAAAGGLPVPERRKLGFNLVNATRPPRGKKKKQKKPGPPKK